MVVLQRLFVGFDDINPNVVGVVLIPLSISQTLQEDLYETETSAGESHSRQTSQAACLFQSSSSKFSSVIQAGLTFSATAELMLLQLWATVLHGPPALPPQYPAGSRTSQDPSDTLL